MPAGSGTLTMGLLTGDGPLLTTLIEYARPLVPAVPVPGPVIATCRSEAGGENTLTVNDPVAALPWPSLARQGTVVRPMGNIAPDPGVHETGTGPASASVAVAANCAAPPAPVVATIVSGDG